MPRPARLCLPREARTPLPRRVLAHAPTLRPAGGRSLVSYPRIGPAITGAMESRRSLCASRRLGVSVRHHLLRHPRSAPPPPLIPAFRRGTAISTSSGQPAPQTRPASLLFRPVSTTPSIRAASCFPPKLGDLGGSPRRTWPLTACDCGNERIEFCSGMPPAVGASFKVRVKASWLSGMRSGPRGVSHCPERAAASRLACQPQDGGVTPTPSASRDGVQSPGDGNSSAANSPHITAQSPPSGSDRSDAQATTTESELPEKRPPSRPDLALDFRRT
jgi:hypothetical protein